ncbi:hypothetical protein ACFW5I_35120 [Streptomyces sp. NPDC058818]|uniref:hypothetical protein n=1 Tax=Streptomyces sp. NPDC058818 TaxID=3346640 RepID=UPI00368D4E99
MDKHYRHFDLGLSAPPEARGARPFGKGTPLNPLRLEQQHPCGSNHHAASSKHQDLLVAPSVTGFRFAHELQKQRHEPDEGRNGK